MTRPYSEDLRERVVRVVESGTSSNAAAKQFDVSISFVVKLMQRWKQRGTIKADKYGGWKKSKLAPHGDRIRALVMENCDITIDELCVLLAAEGIEAKRSTLGDFLLAGAESQKKTAHAAEQERPDRGGASHLAQRAAWADCRTAGLSRRDLGADEHGPALWPGTARRTGGGGHSPWPLEDNHVQSRPDHRALRFMARSTAQASLPGSSKPWSRPCPRATSSSWTTSPPTRSPAYTRPLRRSAQPRSTCRPTAPISIPSNRSSPSSKPFSARSAPEPSMTSGGQLETPSMNSLQPNAETTSSMQDIPSKPDVL